MLRILYILGAVKVEVKLTWKADCQLQWIHLTARLCRNSQGHVCVVGFCGQPSCWNWRGLLSAFCLAASFRRHNAASAESLPNLHRSGLEGGLQKSFQSTTLKVTHSAASTVLANDRNISDVLRTRYVYQILSESVEICTRCGKYLDVLKNVSIIFDWSALTWRRVNDNTLPIFWWPFSFHGPLSPFPH